MITCRKPILSRFSKPGKELLIDSINYTNNRGLTSKQVDFGVPVLISPDGTTRIQVLFKDTTGWSPLEEELTYIRSRFSDIPGCSKLSIHSDYTDEIGIYDDVFEQYGLKLEPEYVTLTKVDEGEYGVVNYLLTFVSHPIFIGEVSLQVRPSLELLGTSIGQLMDLREYYLSGTMNKPPVDLYCPNGEMLLDSTVVPDNTQRATYELALFSILTDSPVQPGTPLVDILSSLTGDDWISELGDPAPFNLNGATVLYNGLRTDEYQVESPAFAYVMVIELSDSCSNLQGLITIGYQYSSPYGAGMLLNDQAANPPIINPR